MTKIGITHVGMVCDDIAATRAELEGRGVEFLTSGIADVAGLKTTWCRDPWGTVIILLEKSEEAPAVLGTVDALGTSGWHVGGTRTVADRRNAARRGVPPTIENAIWAFK